jgi:hypothetical protein
LRVAQRRSDQHGKIVALTDHRYARQREKFERGTHRIPVIPAKAGIQ